MRGQPLSDPKYRYPNPSEQHRELRERLYSYLGGIRCNKCGITDIRVLQLDHKHGGGQAHRRIKGWATIARDILRLRQKRKFQVLCANCHAIKTFENKEQSGRKGTWNE